MSALDSKIDDLYRGPLDAFTASRNALAKTLSGADAKRVRALPKPSLVPWAVNQLYWQARSTYDRLLKSGDRLRKAQIDLLEGRRADVRGAAEAHRAATGDAAKEAMRIASAAGAHPAADAVARTIESLSLMPDPPDPPGRLAEPLQPAGFEALSGVPVRPIVSPAAPVSRSAADARSPTGHSRVRPQSEKEARREAYEREKAEKARALAARAHAAEVKRAEAVLERAKSAAAVAQAEADRAQRAVTDAEAHLKHIRSNGAS